jgi:hypothetical protein
VVGVTETVSSTHFRNQVVAVAPDGTIWVADRNGWLTSIDRSLSVDEKAAFVGGRPTAILIPPPTGR